MWVISRPYKLGLVLPDIHAHYEDRKTMTPVLDYTADEHWDFVIQLGDFLDNNCIASFNDSYPRRKLGETIAEQYRYGGELCDRIVAAARNKNPKCRIIFLEGLPMVSKLNDIMIGAEVETQLKNDSKAELGAISAYNDGIQLAREVGDNGTRELLEGILVDEENHLDWLEAQLDQIDQMGIANYLVEQIG